MGITSPIHLGLGSPRRNARAGDLYIFPSKGKTSKLAWIKDSVIRLITRVFGRTDVREYPSINKTRTCFGNGLSNPQTGNNRDMDRAA